MIANITTGNYTLGMVKYNHDKLKETNINGEKASLLGVNCIKNNEFDTIVKTISSFNNLNPNVNKPNIHISLNFHKQDILTNNQIMDIANDYMKLMDYGSQPYAVYRHFDKEHPHVHIVSSQIDLDGNKIKDSYIYRKSQRISRELELKYNITIATEQTGNKIENKPIDVLINEHLEFNKHSLSGVLSRILLDVLALKPCNDKELDYALLQHQTKRTIFIDDNEKKGNYFHLLKLEDLDNNFIKDKGINGSDIDVTFTYQAIQAQIEINNKTKVSNLKQVMGRVYSIINKPIEQTTKLKLSRFAVDLRKKGIELNVKRKQTGDDVKGIYGLTFVDIKTGITYTASDLKIKTKDFLLKIDDDQKDLELSDGKVFINEANELDSMSHPVDAIIDLSLDGLSSLIESILSTNYANNEEQVNLAEKKKRRKRNK